MKIQVKFWLKKKLPQILHTYKLESLVFMYCNHIISLLSISDWGKPQDFFTYDIAIIIIEKAFKKKFNGKSVRPLCLQGGKGTNWDIPALNADITIIGMGRTGDHP